MKTHNIKFKIRDTDKSTNSVGKLFALIGTLIDTNKFEIAYSELSEDNDEVPYDLVEKISLLKEDQILNEE